MLDCLALSLLAVASRCYPGMGSGIIGMCPQEVGAGGGVQGDGLGCTEPYSDIKQK